MLLAGKQIHQSVTAREAERRGEKEKPLKGFPIRAVSLYWSERRGAQQQLKQAGTGCELLVRFRMGGFLKKNFSTIVRMTPVPASLIWCNEDVQNCSEMRCCLRCVYTLSKAFT